MYKYIGYKANTLKNQLPKTLGYRVTNVSFITANKADAEVMGAYGSIITDTELIVGASHLPGIWFYLENMAEGLRQALQTAVKDVQQNADTMASAARLSISGINSLDGTPQYTMMRHQNHVTETTMKVRGRTAAGGVANANLPIEPAEEIISSDVTVRFKF